MIRPFYFVVSLVAAMAMVTAAGAANVTNQVLINFDGSLTGTTYNLGVGEIDNSGTFASSGMAAVAGGVGDVPGDVDSTSGFYFDGTALSVGALTGVSWVSEARISLDTPVTQQPTHGANDGEGQRNNHFLDVQGDTFYRFNGQNASADKFTEFGYWDGGSEQAITTADLPANQYAHVALVWDAGNTSLTAYLNGGSQGTVDLNAFDDSSSPYVGYGFFSRYIQQAGVGPRSIDGNLSAVAFSTYDGDFNPAADFQLQVPEPNSLLLLMLGLGVLPWLVKR